MSAQRWLPGEAGNDALDRIASLATRLLGVGSAQISLLSDVQTVAGGAGLPAGAIGSCGPLSESLCTVTASDGVPLVVADAVRDDRVNRLPPVASGMVGAYLGVPLTSEAGDIVGALCVFDPTVRPWFDGDVSILQHLAESVEAELELTALARDFDVTQARLDLAVQAGDVGSFDWNLATGELEWDDRLIAMYGYDSGGPSFTRDIESVNRRVHPDDAVRVNLAMSAAIDSVGPLQLQYRVVRADGAVRWLEARGRALAGTDGNAARLIGVSWDVTERREAEARAEQVLSSMSIGFLAIDHEWRITYVNAEGERLLGVERSQLIGNVLRDRVPAAVSTEITDTYRRVATSGVAETYEAFYPAPLNAWFEVRATPSRGGVDLYFLDITDRHDAQDLLQLSVDVAEQMVGAVGVDTAVATLARLVVPRLADWTIVSLVDPAGVLRDVQNWHIDPAMRPAIDRYTATRLEGDGSAIVTDVVHSSTPVVIPARALEFGVSRTHSEVGRAALTELAAESAVVLPLIGGDAVVGVLTLCRGPGRPALSAQELAVTISMCRRAGLAIENVRLQAERAAAAEHDRTVAQALQRALLTRLPQPDRVQLVARYLTAADGDQVGGDWYDAVVSPDGAVTMMIGDVVGHDIAAAAVMGQLRTMLRMLALQYGDSPSTIVRKLDDAARTLNVNTLASVICARIEPVTDDRGPGRRTFRWTNAGHPPPVVVLPDGTTEVLSGESIDILIGVAPESARHDHARQLPPGAIIVLYTDGLIETRTDDLDRGVDRLRESLHRHHGVDPETMLDAVIADMVGDHTEDDVAILAVCLNAEDQPAPTPTR